jgi:hypothetical protein
VSATETHGTTKDRSFKLTCNSRTAAAGNRRMPS